MDVAGTLVGGVGGSGRLHDAGRDHGISGGLDAVLGAIAHPIRRALIERLSTSACTVSELAEPFDVSLPAISHHLRVLKAAGLLEQTREGRVRRCALRADPLSDAFSWLVRYRVSGRTC